MLSEYVYPVYLAYLEAVPSASFSDFCWRIPKSQVGYTIAYYRKRNGDKTIGKPERMDAQLELLRKLNGN